MLGFSTTKLIDKSMQQIRPKSIAEAAFREVTSRVTGGFQAIDEFTRIRLQKTARDGLNADPAVAHQVLAIIAATQWNHAKVDEHYGRAMRIAPHATTYCNYAATLVSLNRFVEAAKLVEMASLCEPANLAYLRMAVDTCWHAGLWERSMWFLQQLEKRSPKEDMRSFSQRRVAMEIVRNDNVPFATIEKLYTSVYAFLSKRRIQSRGWSEFVDSRRDEEAVFVTVEIDQSCAEVDRLDRELTEVLFNAVDNVPVETFAINLGVYEVKR